MVADGPETREDPHDGPEDGPDEGKGQIGQGEGDTEPVCQTLEYVEDLIHSVSLRVPKARGQGHFQEIVEDQIKDRGDGNGNREQGTQRIRSITHIQRIRKRKVVIMNPKYDDEGIEKKKRPREEA